VAEGEQSFHADNIGAMRPAGKVVDFLILPCANQRMNDPDLTSALALRGTDETLRLYRDWAASYDSGFVADMGYRLPAHVAGAFVAAGGTGPVLDVGAGTGLLAAHLRDLGFAGEIDGIDLSPDMLAVAATKGIYRDLTVADITRPLVTPARYRGIVSSGTFTAGHVGPEAIALLLGVAEPDALFALSINERVWTAQGFDTALQGLADTGRIHALHLIEVEVYTKAALALDPAHAKDHAMVALFRAS
jgi:SAM-dependent methyltransferase